PGRVPGPGGGHRRGGTPGGGARASEAERVLCAAARADIDGDGTAREAEVRQTSTAGPVRRQDADGTRTVWDLPADWADQDAPPVVHIGVAQEPAPSGWYTSTPTVTVHAAH